VLSVFFNYGVTSVIQNYEQQIRMSVQTPTVAILERLAERSTSGFSKDEILKLVKIIDSYHDFKVAKRVKGSSGDAKTFSLAASSIESSGSRMSPTSTTEGGHFQIILNNFFNQIFASRHLEADTFFSTHGITKSSPEMSGRDFFERECGTMLHAALGGLCVPTVVRCSDMVKDDFPMTSINSSGALILERDPAYTKSPENNRIIGTKLLKWFFPLMDKGGIGFSFDAQSAVLKDFMKPLNDKLNGFYCSQIVTPQNVLDSAGIGYDVLSADSKKEKGMHFPEFSDKTSRTEYVVSTGEEFSNLFTEDFGKFSIQAGPDFNPETMNFKWLFTPNGKAPIEFNLGPADHLRNTGPGVPFLASMINCILTKKSHAELHSCLDKTQAENDRMVSPVPTIDILDETLQGSDKKWIMRLIYDIKRLGDHEQANAVYYYNSNSKTTKPAIFVTGDTLSALYSRMVGNPSVYIRTEDETKADSNKSSYIMCYRGVDKHISAEDKARMDVENTLSQLNYYLSKISAFIGLATNSDLTKLIENLETYKDAKPFTGEDGELSNLLLKTKIYNSLEFLNNIKKKIEPLTKLLETQKELLLLKLPKVSAAKYENESLTIVLNKDLPIKTLNALNGYLLESMSVLTPQMNFVISDLQYLNNVKVPSKDGGAVFSFHNTLFFSDNKLELKLDTINYLKDDITYTVSSIGNFARRPVSGKRLQDAKDLILKYCTIFLSGFFTTKGFDKATWINSLEELMGGISGETIKQTILSLFSQIIELSIEGNQTPGAELIEAATKATLELEKVRVEFRNASAAAKQTQVATPVPGLGAVVAKEREVRQVQEKLKELVVNASSVLLSAVTKEEKTPETPQIREKQYVKKPVKSETIVLRKSARIIAKEAAKEAEALLNKTDKPLVAVQKAKTKKGGAQELRTQQGLQTQVVYPNAENSIEAVKQKIQEREGIPANQERLIFSGAPLNERSYEEIPEETIAELDKSVLRMKDLFDKLVTIVLNLDTQFPNSITLVPGNYVRDTQVFPYPDDNDENYQLMNVSKSRKQRKANRRQTRKLGGAFILKPAKLGTYSISKYDALDQVRRVDEFLTSLKHYNTTLSTHNESVRANMLRERWYEFTSLLDAEGTPDLAEVNTEEKFSYDIRMLSVYADFSNDIITNLAKEDPLGDLDALDATQIYEFLDPQETKRIGYNNIKAYSEVIEQNMYEKTQIPNEGKYAKNIALCDYNIAMMKKQIEDTKLLIELVGEEAPESIPTKYSLGPVYYFEDEPPSEEIMVTHEVVNTYFTSLKGKAGGSRRKTFKSKKRYNRKTRNM